MRDSSGTIESVVDLRPAGRGEGLDPDDSVLHVDGDDFYASLVRMKSPDLKGRPVIIGNLASRGYVVAASYEARSSGVHPGLTMGQAERICPDASLVQIDWEMAQRASESLMGVLNRYSPLVERSALDAMFLDYRGCQLLFGNSLDFARRLQREIRERMCLSVSVGLAADKAVSAVACRAAKLGRLMDIQPGREQEFLQGCPLEWLPGVTGHLQNFFGYLGIRSIGQLAQIPEGVMEHVLGNDGVTLSRRARSLEHAPVLPRRVADEPEAGKTFPEDVLSQDELTAVLADLSGILGSDLRFRQRSARYVAVKIVYADRIVAQQQTPLVPPSNRDPELFAAVRRVFHGLYQRRVRVRGLTVKARYLVHCPPELPFGDAARRTRWNSVLAAADAAVRKYPGATPAVRLGAALLNSALNFEKQVV